MKRDFKKIQETSEHDRIRNSSQSTSQSLVTGHGGYVPNHSISEEVSMSTQPDFMQKVSNNGYIQANRDSSLTQEESISQSHQKMDYKEGLQLEPIDESYEF